MKSTSGDPRRGGEGLPGHISNRSRSWEPEDSASTWYCGRRAAAAKTLGDVSKALLDTGHDPNLLKGSQKRVGHMPMRRFMRWTDRIKKTFKLTAAPRWNNWWYPWETGQPNICPYPSSPGIMASKLKNDLAPTNWLPRRVDSALKNGLASNDTGSPEITDKTEDMSSLKNGQSVTTWRHNLIRFQWNFLWQCPASLNLIWLQPKPLKNIGPSWNVSPEIRRPSRSNSYHYYPPHPNSPQTKTMSPRLKLMRKKGPCRFQTEDTAGSCFTGFLASLLSRKEVRCDMLSANISFSKLDKSPNQRWRRNIWWWRQMKFEQPISFVFFSIRTLREKGTLN